MKTSLLCSAIVLSVGVYAQQQPSYETEMKRYSQRIDSIVSAEKSLMIKEIETLEKQNLSAQNLGEEKGKIAEKYQHIINQKIENERQKLDELTQKIVKSSVMKPKADTLAEVKKETRTIVGVLGAMQTTSDKKERNPKYYLKDNRLTVSYSFLNLTGNDLNPFNDASKMRVGNSHTVDVMLGRKEQLGNYTSPFFIKYGLAYRADTYMPKRPLVFTEENEILSLQDFGKTGLRRSKLRNNYLVLPLDVEWVINPKYVDYQGEKYLDNRKRQFRVGLGLYAGVKLNSRVKIKYDENGDREKIKYSPDYGINSFLMGGKLSVSYSNFSLFIKKDFTPIFNHKADIPMKNGIQIGIELMNLSFR